jgi:hypothetical protein
MGAAVLERRDLAVSSTPKHDRFVADGSGEERTGRDLMGPCGYIPSIKDECHYC